MVIVDGLERLSAYQRELKAQKNQGCHSLNGTNVIPLFLNCINYAVCEQYYISRKVQVVVFAYIVALQCMCHRIITYEENTRPYIHQI